jgi:SAM-dependent methyltransferase
MSDAQLIFADGEAYERLMGRWSRQVGARFLDWLALPPGLDWLDAGCGNGAFTEVLQTRQSPALLIGLDPSEGQLTYARQRAGAAGAAFQIGDAQSLPFPDATFDAATMALVIAFLPEPARAVGELARVTRPGGMVSTYIWDLTIGGIPLAPLFRALQAVGHPATMPPSSDASRREALAALWRAAGLTGVKTTVIEIPVHFADFADFWTSSTLPAGPQARTIAALPEATRHDLRLQLQAMLPIAADGSITYTATANAVKGRKPG